MKRFCCLALVCMICLSVNTVMITPEEDYQKLVNLEIGWLEENSNTWISPNLTDEEIMGLINVVREAFKKSGKEITDLQAAVAIGIKSTKKAAQESFKKSFMKAQEKLNKK